jgi:glutathione S-transferase
VTEPILHGYFRSGASWRVRIALNLKRVGYADVFRHLRKGEHRTPDYLALNPQGLLPTLEIDGAVFTQSLAICEYLDETRPEPALLPADPDRRARVRAFAQIIACDTHPVQNLKILSRLWALGLAEGQTKDWAAQTIDEGLEGLRSPDRGGGRPLLLRQPGFARRSLPRAAAGQCRPVRSRCALAPSHGGRARLHGARCFRPRCTPKPARRRIGAEISLPI